MPPDRSAYGHFYFWQVTPDYFKTMGIALRQGRALQASDDANAPPVVVINETMARRFWPNESPLGKRIHAELGNGKYSVGPRSSASSAMCRSAS